MEKGTPIELKDIKPGDVVRAECCHVRTHWTATGVVEEVQDCVLFDDGTCSLVGGTYYLLSRPEKVIDKEDLKLKQLVRIEAGERAAEGFVIRLHHVPSNFYQPAGCSVVTLLGSEGREVCFVIDAITKVVLLS